MASAFNNFIIITEKLNIEQIPIIKDSFPGNFPIIKIVTIAEAKSFPKIKKIMRLWWITSKILKACASLFSYPWSFIYDCSLYTGISPDHLKISVVKPLKRKKTELV